MRCLHNKVACVFMKETQLNFRKYKQETVVSRSERHFSRENFFGMQINSMKFITKSYANDFIRT